MADDLTKPLMGNGGGPKRPALVGILLTILAAALIGVVLWLVLTVDLDPNSVEPTETADNGPGEVQVFAPGANGSGVVITTPGGAVLGAPAQPEATPAVPETLVLSPDPNPELLENGPYGMLPRVAASGLRPFDAYARPFSALGRTALVAIIVGGIGINESGSNLALAELPGEITLALAPYGQNLDDWVTRARQGGHELLLQLPLEPIDFPVTDPGPHTLLAGDTAAENLDRLNWLLAQTTTYAGVVSYAGGRFLREEGALTPVVAELAARGLMLIDDGSVRQSMSVDAASGVLPFAKADLVLDQEVDAGAIAARLSQLQRLAVERGYAIATASAFPVTIREIAAWAEVAVANGITLVPVTALANDPATDAAVIRIE